MDGTKIQRRKRIGRVGFILSDMAKKSIADAMAFSSRDWSIDRRDAWIYGIVLGWDDASYEVLKKKHKWTDSEVERNKLLYESYNKEGWDLF